MAFLSVYYLKDIIKKKEVNKIKDIIEATNQGLVCTFRCRRTDKIPYVLRGGRVQCFRAQVLEPDFLGSNPGAIYHLRHFGKFT